MADEPEAAVVDALIEEQMQNLNQLMNQYEALRDQLRILGYA